MKSLKTLATLIVLAFFVGIAPAFAVTLSLTDKGGGVVDVVVDNSSNVLGVAFTVNYDSTKLTAPTVDSSYFGTFQALYNTTSVDGYDSPLVDNDSETGKLKISAACPTANSAVKTLFTITFSIVTGATGTANVSIVPTTMSAVAGYSAGDQLPVVVGYNASSTTDTYPVLLSSATLTSSPVSANLNTGSGTAFNLDIDGNGVMEGLKDGLLLYRYTSGWNEGAYSAIWTTGAIGAGATRDKTQIEDFLNAAKLSGELDIDGNGIMEGLKDGLLLYRYTSGWNEGAYSAIWTTGAIGAGATRDKTQISEYLAPLKP